MYGVLSFRVTYLFAFHCSGVDSMTFDEDSEDEEEVGNDDKMTDAIGIGEGSEE